MGCSACSEKKEKENLDAFDNDQYSCIECHRIPEVKSIDYDKGEIVYECPKHGEKKMKLGNYFEAEKINKKCKCSRKFTSYCVECEQYYCDLCKKEDKHQLKLIDIKDIDCKCHKHLKDYNTYCKKCREHFCEDCENNCKHKKININELTEHDTTILEKRIEFGEYLIKILKTLLESYNKHKTNYFLNINIKNIANYDKIAILTAKLKNAETKIANYFDSKHNITLNDKSKEIDLYKKQLTDYELSLLSIMELRNIEKISLKENKINTIEPFKDMALPNLREIDLSYNLISDVNRFKDILNNNKEIRYINLEDNKIKNIDVFKDIFKENEFEKLKRVNLERNKELIQSDLNEIKALIKKDNECVLIYKLDKSQKMHYFGEDFLKDNQYNIILEIEEEGQIKTMKYVDFTQYMINHEQDTIIIRLLIDKFVTDLKCIFEGCSMLKSIDGIEDWNTCDMTNFSNFFKDCSLLEKIPDISNWDTSQITDMSNMFNGCSSLTELPDISNWKIHKVKDMQCMFSGCSKLKVLPDISKWNFANVNNINYIFHNCESLTSEPDINNWNLKNATLENYLKKK